jgi:nucleotide-binding universal stress UspA family protein
MYDRILVPLDGSKTGDAVLPYVEELARRLGASIELVQAIPTTEMLFREAGSPAAPELGMEVARGRRETEEAVARRHLESTKARFEQAGIPTTVTVLEGAPAFAILEHARASEASLIAMATHGRGGLSRLLAGSVADEVLRNSPIPVLVVRPR